MPFSARRIIGGGSAVVTEKGDGLKMSTSPEKRSESFATPHLTHSASFLEQHPLTTHVPIPEEDEDETSSEPAEAITPISDSHPSFHHGIDGLTGFPPKPLMVNTPANVMLRDAAQISNKPLPTSAPTSQPSKPASKSIRALFRRSNSHATDQITYNPLNASSLTAASPMAVQSSRRKLSYSASHSPATSQSNTPPSPSSPTSTVHSSSEKAWEPAALKKEARSSTGLSLKIGFGHTPKPPRSRKRSSSVNNFSHLLPQRDDFSRPAETGAGLKARRMSISLPDDFIVDAIELDEEFTSASRLPGKRGKFIGKGATATVKLMTRKGAGDEVYAVKEFRKRGQHEDPEEYDKKVKSEYTIAKSLHHPNIVESVRLCTHAGRWNVVMEYCQYGELFSLVEKKYLDMDSKLCLWKQLLRGVNYLHNHGIAHRDIKLENLLMNDKGHLKITDFGVSDVFCGEHPGVREAGGECGKNMKEVRRSAPGICGSLPYIAPEVLAKNGHYDPRPLDVWSCAIVMLSMIFNGGPWAEATKSQPTYAKFAAAWEDLEARKKEGNNESNVPANPGKMFTAITKPALRSLILRMLHPDPEKRISIHETVNEGWVKLIDCCAFDGDDEQTVTEIDASKKCGKAAKKTIAKSHHHLPPEKHWVPQHRFDMGDGWY